MNHKTIIVNAKTSILTGLFLLGFNGAAVAAESLAGMSQQELNKLGQQTAKTNKVHDNFKVNDDSLKQINPDYAQTDLVSTYNSNRPANEQGSAKKWQCLSFTDAEIAQMYKSTDVSKKQLATECDPIRAAEKTNDTMDGRYGDPLENELVRLFTNRQNEQINNATKGDVNIECTPLGGTAGQQRDEACVINTIPVEKTCVRTLKVVCYNALTGKLLDGTEVCGTDKMPTESVSSLGDWAAHTSHSKYAKFNSYTDYTATNTNTEAFKNTVTANVTYTNLGNYDSRNVEITYTFNFDPKKHGNPFIKYFKHSEDGRAKSRIKNPWMSINGQNLPIPAQRSTYSDIEGEKLLGAELFKAGVNTVKIGVKIESSGGLFGSFVSLAIHHYEVAIGFKSKCAEVICEESWEESCVDRGFLGADETLDEVID